MNLIEELGGYENAKERLKRENVLTDSDYNYGQKKLLEYRRANNIFEVGDKYVMLKIQHDEILTVLESEIDELWFNTRIIRHATPQEIQCGHRLASIEVLRDCDIPPCTIVLPEK